MLSLAKWREVRWIEPTSVAAPSQALVCDLSLAGSAGLNAVGMHKCLPVVSVLCCQVEVFASGWSLGQRSPTECGVSECDREVSIMRKSWSIRGWSAIKRWTQIERQRNLHFQALSIGDTVHRQLCSQWSVSTEIGTLIATRDRTT
jgi:hypothetical protein